MGQKCEDSEQDIIDEAMDRGHAAVEPLDVEFSFLKLALRGCTGVGVTIVDGRFDDLRVVIRQWEGV